MRRIIVRVKGGAADVDQPTVPAGTEVEVRDYDIQDFNEVDDQDDMGQYESEITPSLEGVDIDSDTLLNEVKDTIKAFEKLRNELSGFGARETGTENTFQHTIASTLYGRFNAPHANRWELFVGKDGSRKAGERLTEQCQKVLNLIKVIPLGGIGSLRKYLENYCWRVNFD